MARSTDRSAGLMTIGQIEEKFRASGWEQVPLKDPDVIQYRFPNVSGIRHTMLGPRDRYASSQEWTNALNSMADIARRR